MAQSDKEALSLYQLIGAPLLAVVQAEAQAAQVSAAFIKEVGFARNAPGPEQDAPPPQPGTQPPPQPGTQESPSPARALQEGGDIGDLKMLQFSHQVRGVDGGIRQHLMSVPVLSLFPIPLLQVKDAQFDFTIRILDHESRGPQLTEGNVFTTAGSAAGLSEFLSQNRIELKGSIGRESAPGGAERSSDMQLKVKIRMEQADMPAGLLKLLNIMDQTISSTPAQPMAQDQT